MVVMMVVVMMVMIKLSQLNPRRCRVGRLLVDRLQFGCGVRDRRQQLGERVRI
jgi:hypothetical protein